MTDKRYLCDGFPAQKRAKTFPLIQNNGIDADTGTNDEENDIVVSVDRRSTALGLETEAEEAPVANHATETHEAQSDAKVLSPLPEDSASPVGQSSEIEITGSGSSPTADQPETEIPQTNIVADEVAGEETEPCASTPRNDESSLGNWLDTSDQDNLFPDSPERPGPWTAPPEPLRPVNPYGEGRKLMLRRHVPSPPFGDDYPDYPGIRQPVPDNELRTLTQVELCLQNPPMEGETAADPPRILHITGKIRVKDDGGAQLVTCRLDDEPYEYVAKIYDPLYYGFSDRMWSDQPRDVADEADKDYCREAAAYLELDDQFGGEETPKYHGSWTFEMPLDLPTGSTVRNVRAILMERVPGRTMLHVKPDPYPESVRLDTLARVLEALEKMAFAGVRHGDFSQRNIILCDGDSADTIGRIVIIDFNFATVTRLDNWEEKYGERLPKGEKPRNPLDQWWDGGLYGGFGNWLPASWEQRLKPLQEWLYQRWSKSEEFLAPKENLTWDEKNTPGVYCSF